MLTATRRASSFFSTFACRASVGLSREYRQASSWPLVVADDVTARDGFGEALGSGVMRQA
jgi:hypothetical protein